MSANLHIVFPSIPPEPFPPNIRCIQLTDKFIIYVCFIMLNIIVLVVKRLYVCRGIDRYSLHGQAGAISWARKESFQFMSINSRVPQMINEIQFRQWGSHWRYRTPSFVDAMILIARRRLFHIEATLENSCAFKFCFYPGISQRLASRAFSRNAKSRFLFF